MTAIAPSPALSRPRVRVVAPARAPVTANGCDLSAIERGLARLEALGCDCELAGNVGLVWQRFAGTDAERAAGLNAAFREPGLSLIMALRGGYGSTRLLPLIDWAAAARAAPFMGFSDCTAISLALLARAGRSSWQGPTLLQLDHRSARRDRSFLRALRGEDWRVSLPARPGLPEGGATGPLWGGNLSLLTSLVGTEYLPAIDGGLLFIEDVAEPAWRVERMLLQLLDCGLLRRQRALIIGDLSGVERGVGEGPGRFELADALSWIARRDGPPIFTGLPFGHRPDTLTVPVGVPAALTLRRGRLELRAGPCPRAPEPRA